MQRIIIISTFALVTLCCSFAVAENDGKYLQETFPSGLTVIIKHNPDSRVFAVNILGKNRAVWEKPEQEGITDLVNRMLVKGTKSKNAEEVQAALDDIGARLKTNDSPYIPYDDRYTWRAFSFVRFETIDEYAEDGMKILAEIISQPSFDENELTKINNQLMGIMGMESGSTYKVCRNLFYSKLFENHSLSNQVLGNQRTLMGITRDQLIDYHSRYYSGGNLIITVVSNIEPKKVLKWVKKQFKKIPGSPKDIVAMPTVNKTAGIIEVNQPMEKEQVFIYLGNLIPGLNSDDTPAIKLAVGILSSRLRLNLREKQGLAYSIGAGARFLEDFGWFTCTMGTGYENFKIARDGILAEIEILKNEPVAQAELDKARNSQWGSMLMRNMSCINQAYNMAYYEYVNAGYNYDDSYKDRFDKITIEDVQNVAVKYFDTENYVQAYVGKVAE